VDILVNNVAITDRSTIFELSEEEWDRVMRVCVKTTFLCSKYVAKRMADQGDGGCILSLKLASDAPKEGGCIPALSSADFRR
jgi:3-oxoacyl-[acyl-carrier protein] reductase